MTDPIKKSSPSWLRPVLLGAGGILAGLALGAAAFAALNGIAAAERPADAPATFSTPTSP